MDGFREWLGQVGLAHCRPILQAHGLDFQPLTRLSEDDLCRLGLDRADSRRLLREVALRTGAVRSAAQVAGVLALDPPLTFPDERRQQLTIMFCDLVGSTDLAHRLDPEELGDEMRAFISACCARVRQYDGSVIQVLGDAVLVYFGHPTAHADDAERSVRAALDIVDAIPKVQSREPFAVRIGIATGQVVVGGPRGAGALDVGLAIGEPPNLAARLQSQADPNQILISHATRSLLGDAFELTDLGAIPLAGFGPSRVWRVEAARRAAGRFEASHGESPLTTLVGRAEELSQLQREWELARDGMGRAVLITGEAGIGKSRLAQALREQIRAELHTPMCYQCSPFHEVVPLYPVVAQIELAARFAREDTAAQKLDKLENLLVGDPARRTETAALVAALLSLPADRYPSLGLSPQKQREKTLEALLHQVEALAAIVPVLMVVEDVQWIDPTTQELIDALVPRLPALRVLFLVTSRLELHDDARGWIHSPQLTTIALKGLAQAQGAALARHVAKGKALPAEVIDQIVVRADGLPLYLEELTRSVLELPQLLEEADRYTLIGPVPMLKVPPTLQDLLKERLGRTEEMKQLAQIAALIGRSFSYEVLATVAAPTVKDFDRVLDELTRTELVFRRGTPPDATYTFKHALVQDAAYGVLPLKSRPALHAQIATLLEGRFPDLAETQPELLAHHRTEAGQLTAAIPLWRRAGESALARVALQEAVSYLEKGLAIVEQLPASDDRDTLELSLREPLHTARLRWRGWAAPDVGANATAILWLAQRQRRPQSLLIGLWGTWINVITQGRVAESSAWARRLLAEGIQTGDFDLRIFGHRALLSSHFYIGELQKSLEQRTRILELYDPARASRWMQLTGNDTKTAVGVFGSQALWMLGFPEEAARECEEKDAHARALGNPFDIGWAVTWGAYVWDYRREADRLFACAAEAGRIGREQSIPVLLRVLAPIVEGFAHLRSGQIREALALLRAGIDGWRATGGYLNLPYVTAVLAEALARDGDFVGGLRLLDECREQIERPGWHERVWLPEVLRLKGWVLLHMGRPVEAEAQLRASIGWAQQQEARSWELRSTTTLAELLVEGGRRDAARELLVRLCDSFPKDLDTHDLRAARSLVDAL